ncbi:MAG: TonB-dependent receptor [Hyphomonadaceae bacterium]
MRAASLPEPFSPRVAGYANVRDPQQNNQLYPTVPVSVGNPDLQPEEADTKTLGIVYRPEFLPEFFVSVDYYNIEIAGQIGSLGFQRIVDLCTAGTQQYCDLIHRRTNGFITTHHR